MKNKIFAAALVAALSGAGAVETAAQELRSSYFMKTSTYRHQINPALLTETYVGMPFLGNLNIGTQGNVGLKNFIYKLDGNPNYDLTTFMNPQISTSEFLDGLSGKNRINIHLNENIFSTAFAAFGGINLVELNLRSNTHVNLPYELFEFMKSAGSKDHYSLEDIGMRTQNYAELAFGHSRAIDEKLRVGAKVKLLFGLAYAELESDQLDLTLTDDVWAIEGDLQLNAALMKTKLDYEDEDKNSPDGRRRVSGLDDFSGGLAGFGLGFDFGASYQFNEDLLLSASLTDVGFISWSGVYKASSAGSWQFEGFDNIYAGSDKGEDGRYTIGQQFEDLGDDLEEIFSVYEDGKGGKTTALAATLNLGAEYTMPFYRNLSAGFLYTSRFAGAYSFHQGMLSAQCRPVSWVEASLNTSVSSTGWAFGGMLSFYMKRFNFFVGSDRFLGKVSKELFIPLNNMNANIAFGINFPLSNSLWGD